jgi:7-cyano-7-deazaguanine synthase
MKQKPYKAVVLHSGGIDSSLSLYLALKKWGPGNVVSLGFSYKQRHKEELEAAKKIADFFHVERVVLELPPLLGWESSSLVNKDLPIKKTNDQQNSYVPSRNGIFMMLSAPFIKRCSAKELYVGLLEHDGRLSGYPDCSREYADLVEAVIKKDLQDEEFSIISPLVFLTKEEVLEIAFEHHILEPLLDMSISCYEGVSHIGCKKCPSCILRNNALSLFFKKNPSFQVPEKYSSLL